MFRLLVLKTRGLSRLARDARESGSGWGLTLPSSYPGAQVPARPPRMTFPPRRLAGLSHTSPTLTCHSSPSPVPLLQPHRSWCPYSRLLLPARKPGWSSISFLHAHILGISRSISSNPRPSLFLTPGPVSLLLGACPLWWVPHLLLGAPQAFLAPGEASVLLKAPVAAPALRTTCQLQLRLGSLSATEPTPAAPPPCPSPASSTWLQPSWVPPQRGPGPEMVTETGCCALASSGPWPRGRLSAVTEQCLKAVSTSLAKTRRLGGPEPLGREEQGHSQATTRQVLLRPPASPASHPPTSLLHPPPPHPRGPRPLHMAGAAQAKVTATLTSPKVALLNSHPTAGTPTQLREEGVF